MFRLRGGLARNGFGLLNEGLYSRAFSGTKKQVNEYQRAVISALDAICGPDPSGASSGAASGDLPTDVKLAFFNETRHVETPLFYETLLSNVSPVHHLPPPIVHIFRLTVVRRLC